MKVNRRRDKIKREKKRKKENEKRKFSGWLFNSETHKMKFCRLR